MKRVLLAWCLSCLLLLTFSACGRGSAASADDNIVYGQVVKTDENQNNDRERGLHLWRFV